jgi:hypothetical protein
MSINGNIVRELEPKGYLPQNGQKRWAISYQLLLECFAKRLTPMPLHAISALYEEVTTHNNR